MTERRHAPETRRTVDWDAARRRIEANRDAVRQAFEGEGAWADRVLRRRTEELARLTDADPEQRAGVCLLIAHGERLRYGLDISEIASVVPLPRVIPVPGAPPDLLGLIALGGRVMRLFDLDRLCGESGPPGADAGFAVVLKNAALPTALRVLAMDEVAERDARDMMMDGSGDGGRPSALVARVTGDRVAVLDLGALIDRVGGRNKYEP